MEEHLDKRKKIKARCSYKNTSIVDSDESEDDVYAVVMIIVMLMMVRLLSCKHCLKPYLLTLYNVLQ